MFTMLSGFTKISLIAYVACPPLVAVRLDTSISLINILFILSMPEFVHLVSMGDVYSPHAIYNISIVVGRPIFYYHSHLGLMSSTIPQLAPIKEQTTLGNVYEIAFMIFFNLRFPLEVVVPAAPGQGC